MFCTHRRKAAQAKNDAKNRYRKAAAVLAVAATLLLHNCAPATAPYRATANLTLAVETATDPHLFVVEIATTPEAWQRGLRRRPSLAAGHGMLFVFPTPMRARMWMEETLIPLDMLFIDADSRIIHIEHQAEPLSRARRAAGKPVLAVLEIAGGSARQLGIRPGDRVLPLPGMPGVKY